MFKTRFLSLLVLLCLTVSGAWAGQETPLITILSADNTDFKSGSKTFDDKVTVTFSGNVNYYSEYGWFSAQERTLTVTAAEGYTITGVKFYKNEGSGFDDEAPFEAILGYEDDEYFAKVNGTSIGAGDGGVTKIEVYGYADTPEPTTYDVTMKEGTLDATSWLGKAGSGEYQALPLEGVAAGTAVTVKYNGRKKVKNITIEKAAPADPLAVPLTMEALTDGNIVVNIMGIGGARRYDFPDDYPEPSKRVPGRRGSSNISVKYSVNGGEKTTIYEETETTTIPVNAGDKVQFYGDVTSTQFYGGDPHVVLQGTAQTKVYGNIMSLLDEDNYATLTTLPDGTGNNFGGLFMMNENLTDASGLLLPATTTGACYFAMFGGCTSLTAAPALPATELAEQCYIMMFFGCTSLTTAPALPATELAGGCYFGMFQGCTSLTTAPTLPATELASSCYSSMFTGCTSLVTAPALPATTLTESCYGSMFEGCTSLTTAPTLPAATLVDYCYSSMFSGCTSLTTAPALPAETLVEGCYQNMFEGCTSLVTAPALPAETLASDCYRSMFNGCTSLNSVTCMATDISASNCITNWLQNVAATGTFITPASTNWTTNSPSGIPTGWTRVDPNAILPLTMEALTAGNIQVSISTTLTTGMKYSVNNGEKTLINTTTTIPVNAGDMVQFYGNGTSTQVYGGDPMVHLQGTAQTKVYGNIMSLIDETGYATLTTLPNQDNVFLGLFYSNTNLTDASGLLLPSTTLAVGCYASMFAVCTSLTTAPTLPATTLAEGCYVGMFGGCTSLTTAPALPAMMLAGECYSSMFYGCTSLTTAPALPATTLAESCYSNMFQGCTSLTTAPVLPATTLASSCYYEMFNGCTSLTTAPALPSTTLANGCYRNMFKGCTSLTTAPALPAETLANYCYYGMFYGCTSLTTAPVLPATTLVYRCYKNMFYGCTNLNSVTCMATDISADDCTTGWLDGVAATGTFITPASTGWGDGANGIPSGWTRVDPNAIVPLTMEALTDGTVVVNNPKSGMQYSLNGGAKAPVTSEAIPVSAGDKVAFYGNGTSISNYNGTGISGGTAQVKVYGNIMSLIDETGYATLTTLLNQNYVFMGLFYGNTNLTDASGLLLPATTLAEGCYYGMFAGCTSLTAAPTLPATTLANSCYGSMFSGCTSLTTAPALPAETLASECYSNMFEGCTSLVTAPALPATTLANNCYGSMFSGCTSLVTAPALPATTLSQYCYQLMFSGCTSLTTAPVLPATTLANYCYNAMFLGCTSLTTAPALPAETLVEGCYYGMFNGCTSLNSVTCMATDISASYCTTGWLDGVAPTGTFTKASGATWPTSVDGIPSGWTVETPAPAAKAAAEATAEDKGKLIGTDGNIYADVAAATAAGTTAVAKIIYIGETGHGTYSHGLALALTDEGKKEWEVAIEACSDKNTTTPVTGATWLLASKDQWQKMGAIDDSQTYTALRDGFSGISGADNLQSGYYWSSTEDGSYDALRYNFDLGSWSEDDKLNDIWVRACLAF